MAATTPSDDATLARRAADGCVASFSELTRRYQVPVVHYVLHLAGGGGADADDVAQDAFLRAWRHVGDYDPQWAFSTWLFTIARRSWLNQSRATRRRRVRERAVAVVDSIGCEAVADAIATERATRLWQVARAELTEREFTALWMRYVEEKPVAEIALVLDKPVTTVKGILFRARRRLQPFVRDLAGGSD